MTLRILLIFSSIFLSFCECQKSLNLIECPVDYEAEIPPLIIKNRDILSIESVEIDCLEKSALKFSMEVEVQKYWEFKINGKFNEAIELYLKDLQFSHYRRSFNMTVGNVDSKNDENSLEIQMEITFLSEDLIKSFNALKFLMESFKFKMLWAIYSEISVVAEVSGELMVFMKI